MSEYDFRRKWCARYGHRPVAQLVRRPGVPLRVLFVCSRCGCGLVADRYGWRVRQTEVEPAHS